MKSTSHITHELRMLESCSPIPDPIVFIDCIVSTARVEILADKSVSVNTKSFDELFVDYLGECSDHSPIAGENNCEDLADLAEGKSCSSLVEAGFCKFSCRACNSRVPVTESAKVPVSVPSTVSPVAKTTSTAGPSVNVLISSDWHVEPWYLESTNDDQGKISR